MLTSVPLTVVPLVLFNLIGFLMGGDPWGTRLFGVPMVSGATWNVTLFDVMVLLSLAVLFVEIMRSAHPGRPSTVTNHVVSTIILLVYVVEFFIVPVAANSLFFLLMLVALFDVIVGFTISIRTAQRDISFGGGIDGSAGLQ